MSTTDANWPADAASEIMAYLSSGLEFTELCPTNSDIEMIIRRHLPKPVEMPAGSSDIPVIGSDAVREIVFAQNDSYAWLVIGNGRYKIQRPENIRRLRLAQGEQQRRGLATVELLDESPAGAPFKTASLIISQNIFTAEF